jgi:hypothetical protein
MQQFQLNFSRQLQWLQQHPQQQQQQDEDQRRGDEDDERDDEEIEDDPRAWNDEDDPQRQRQESDYTSDARKRKGKRALKGPMVPSQCFHVGARDPLSCKTMRETDYLYLKVNGKKFCRPCRDVDRWIQKGSPYCKTHPENRADRGAEGSEHCIVCYKRQYSLKKLK